MLPHHPQTLAFYYYRRRLAKALNRRDGAVAPHQEFPAKPSGWRTELDIVFARVLRRMSDNKNAT